MSNKEELKKAKEVVEEAWKETYGITGEEVVNLTDAIECIFHEYGYVISHAKIAHFVVDCIKKGS